MTTVRIQEAKTHLSRLLHAVEQGDEVVIARGDVAVARLVPINPGGRRELGFLPVSVGADAFAPLDGDELTGWE